MKQYFLLLILFFLKTSNTYAQQDYWQQEVNYNIEVKLDDEKHFLHASEAIEYINNSPDELTFLWFHLWPNAYKNNQTAFARQQLQMGKTRFYYAKDAQLGYIDSLDFSVNGEKVKWEYHPDHIDIAKIYLNQPLRPGERITITTPFRVKLPDSFSRLGHVGQQYQITQWYPKPAVYDPEGWHPMPYLDMGEFYSEFGRFEVSITLPENYIVGATGNLQTESEQMLLDSLAVEKWQESIYRYSDNFRKSRAENKTITYLQENVHDFAWFADKTYRVRKDSMQLPHTDRTITLYAMYNDTNFDVWEDIMTYMKDATYYYSLWIGDYAYDVITVVDGALSAGAGMEYPTITVLGASDEFGLETVTMHEIGHNWFYGILANNERADAWMDEGINSYYEKRYIETKYPDKKLITLLGDLEEAGSFFEWIAETTQLKNVEYSRYYELGYMLNARRNEDQASGLRATEFTDINYGTMVYMKPAVFFGHLEKYLGTEEFDRIMKIYYDRWKFKHPKPEDVHQLFEKESGRDLDWLFEDLVKTDKKLDYKISGIEPGNNGVQLTMKNVADIPAPMPVVALSGEDTVTTTFVEGFKGKKSVTLEGAGIDRVLIDPQHYTLDLYRHNNQIYRDKLFKKSNQIKLLPIGGIEIDDKSELYFLPAFGLNTRDKFMLGAAFYNNVFPQQKFNFAIMPMYSFGLNQLSGSADISYNFYPNSLFQNIEVGVLGRRYAGFNKLDPSLSFTFMKKDFNTSPTQRLNFSYNFIDVDTSLLGLYKPYYEVFSGSYSIDFGNPILRFGLATEVQVEPGEWSVWNNQAIAAYQYMSGKVLRMRLFYGTFLNQDNVHPSFALRMSGSTDYLMESTFLDRAMISEKFVALEHQTDLRQGGFRNYLPSAYSNDWLFAANFNLDIPVIGFFSIYGDVGLLPGSDLLYDTGLQFGFIRNALRVYVPLAGSNFNGFVEGFNQMGEQIRFTLDLNRINPLKIIKTAGN